MTTDTTKTEREGPIELTRGMHKLRLEVRSYATEHGEPAKAADIIAALSADPQLRAAVLAPVLRGMCDSDFDEYLRALPTPAPDEQERALATAHARLRAAESALAAARLENSGLSYQLGKAQGEAEGHALARKGLESELAELKVRNELAEVDLYNIGATRGDVATRAKTARSIYDSSISDRVEADEKIERLESELAEARAALAETRQLAEERLNERNQLLVELDAEQSGRIAMRDRHGARDDETFGVFIQRLVTESIEAKSALATERARVVAAEAMVEELTRDLEQMCRDHGLNNYADHLARRLAYRPAEPVCVCGHSRAQHSPEKGLCLHNSCGGCETFTPAEQAAPVAEEPAVGNPPSADDRCPQVRASYAGELRCVLRHDHPGFHSYDCQERHAHQAHLGACQCCGTKLPEPAAAQPSPAQEPATVTCSFCTGTWTVTSEPGKGVAMMRGDAGVCICENCSFIAAMAARDHLGEDAPLLTRADVTAIVDSRVAELARAAESAVLKGGCHHATQVALAELRRAAGG